MRQPQSGFRATEESVNEIVVGLDESGSSYAALQWAARYARFSYTDLRAVHVSSCSPGSAMSWAAGFPGTEGLLLDSEPDSKQQGILETMFEAVQPEPDWVLEHHVGCAGAVLVSESRAAQLLVIGTHPRSRLARIMSGSTGHYCLSHAESPVLAVPAPRLRLAGGSGAKYVPWGQRRRGRADDHVVPPSRARDSRAPMARRMVF